MTRRLFAMLVAALVAIGIVGASPSLAVVPTGTVQWYAYDSPNYTSPTSNASERGPPAKSYGHAATIAVDDQSRGTSARPEAAANYPYTNYDLLASPIQSDSNTGTTGMHVAANSGDLRALPPSQVAAKTAPINGETAATALGRAMHKSWDYGPGFTKEFTLKAGGRVDALNMQTRHVIELKPNNPRAIRLGERQLDGYIEKLNAQFPGEPWTGSVVTYP